MARGQNDPALLAEPKDPDWGPRIENLLHLKIADSGHRLASLSIDCRTTGCLVLMRELEPQTRVQTRDRSRWIWNIAKELTENPSAEIEGSSTAATSTATRLRLMRASAD
jgi:hypothetical protein